jgi:hypothetical protein
VRVIPQYELANSSSNQRVLCSLIQVTLTWRLRGQRKVLDLQTVRTVAQKGL